MISSRLKRLIFPWNIRESQRQKYRLKELVLLSGSTNNRLETEIFMWFYFIFINGLKSKSSLKKIIQIHFKQHTVDVLII